MDTNNIPIGESISPTRNTESSFYKIGFWILLFLAGFLSGLLIYQNRNFKEIDLIGTQVTTITPTVQAEISNTPPTSYVLNLPEASVTQTPIASPTISTTLLQSVVCPVQFTVPEGRIFVTNKGQYARWQLRESEERFFLLPRAEETNGKQVTAELRIEGQQYYNGEAEVRVQCQDNPNKWKQDDFLTYVLKSDSLKDARLSKTQMWGREVSILIYTMGSSSYTYYLLATPTKLYHVRTTVYNQEFQNTVNDIFASLKFN